MNKIQYAAYKLHEAADALDNLPLAARRRGAFGTSFDGEHLRQEARHLEQLQSALTDEGV